MPTIVPSPFGPAYVRARPAVEQARAAFATEISRQVMGGPAPARAPDGKFTGADKPDKPAKLVGADAVAAADALERRLRAAKTPAEIAAVRAEIASLVE